jgi:hypothetical protein
MRHRLDVSTLFAGTDVPGFNDEPCFMLYPSDFPTAFAFSNFSILPLQQHALR